METGFDTFYAEPGTIEEISCRVCHTTCDARRDVIGPTGHAMAIAGGKVRHDAFTCPHSGEAWHDEALRLRKALDETPSETIASIMRHDLAQLLADNR